MSDSLRPEPLRVPVVDVATRNSLVGQTSQPQAQLAGGAVVQRAVRIVSDHPAPMFSSAPPPARDARQEMHRERAPSMAPPSETPTVKTASVPPPPPLDSDVAGNGQAAGAQHADESTGNHGYANERSEPGAWQAADTDESQQYDYGAMSMGVEPLDGPLELNEDMPVPSADASFDGPALEDEALDDEALEDEALEDEALEDEALDEEELDAASLEMSIPPPPPAQASSARRPVPSNNDVEITVSYDDGDEDDRSSGEFEELDVEAAMRNVAGDHTRTPPPPPPAGRLSSLAEPPDLQTLTRTARVAEARPSKPRAHPWWEVFFDDDYLRTVRPPTHQQIARQCDFLAKRLSLKPGATVLDVGCGLGLQAVELASRGYLSVGLDLSLAMLSRASEEAQARGTKINFLHADMRDMNFEGNFDAVMCIGTSLGYFDDDTNKKVIERLFRALKPNGVLLLDVVNRDHVIRTQPNLIWFEGEGCVCMEESEFNFFTSRLHVKRTVILESGKQRENEYSLRLYSLHELGQLLHQFGFRVIEVSGREALPGVFFGQESPNMMVVAERRSSADGTGKYPALVD